MAVEAIVEGGAKAAEVAGKAAEATGKAVEAANKAKDTAKAAKDTSSKLKDAQNAINKAQKAVDTANKGRQKVNDAQDNSSSGNNGSQALKQAMPNKEQLKNPISGNMPDQVPDEVKSSIQNGENVAIGTAKAAAGIAAAVATGGAVGTGTAVKGLVQLGKGLIGAIRDFLLIGAVVLIGAVYFIISFLSNLVMAVIKFIWDAFVGLFKTDDEDENMIETYMPNDEYTKIADAISKDVKEVYALLALEWEEDIEDCIKDDFSSFAYFGVDGSRTEEVELKLDNAFGRAYSYARQNPETYSWFNPELGLTQYFYTGAGHGGIEYDGSISPSNLHSKYSGWYREEGYYTSKTDGGKHYYPVGIMAAKMTTFNVHNAEADDTGPIEFKDTYTLKTLALGAPPNLNYSDVYLDGWEGYFDLDRSKNEFQTQTNSGKVYDMAYLVSGYNASKREKPISESHSWIAKTFKSYKWDIKSTEWDADVAADGYIKTGWNRVKSWASKSWAKVKQFFGDDSDETEKEAMANVYFNYNRSFVSDFTSARRYKDYVQEVFANTTVSTVYQRDVISRTNQSLKVTVEGHKEYLIFVRDSMGIGYRIVCNEDDLKNMLSENVNVMSLYKNNIKPFTEKVDGDGNPYFAFDFNNEGEIVPAIFEINIDAYTSDDAADTYKHDYNAYIFSTDGGSDSLNPDHIGIVFEATDIVSQDLVRDGYFAGSVMPQQSNPIDLSTNVFVNNSKDFWYWAKTPFSFPKNATNLIASVHALDISDAYNNVGQQTYKTVDKVNGVETIGYHYKDDIQNEIQAFYNDKNVSTDANKSDYDSTNRSYGFTTYNPILIHEETAAAPWKKVSYTQADITWDTNGKASVASGDAYRFSNIEAYNKLKFDHISNAGAVTPSIDTPYRIQYSTVQFFPTTFVPLLNAPYGNNKVEKNGKTYYFFGIQDNIDTTDDDEEVANKLNALYSGVLSNYNDLYKSEFTCSYDNGNKNKYVDKTLPVADQILTLNNYVYHDRDDNGNPITGKEYGSFASITSPGIGEHGREVIVDFGDSGYTLKAKSNDCTAEDIYYGNKDNYGFSFSNSSFEFNFSGRQSVSGSQTIEYAYTQWKKVSEEKKTYDASFYVNVNAKTLYWYMAITTTPFDTEKFLAALFEYGGEYVSDDEVDDVILYDDYGDSYTADNKEILTYTMPNFVQLEWVAIDPEDPVALAEHPDGGYMKETEYKDGNHNEGGATPKYNQNVFTVDAHRFYVNGKEYKNFKRTWRENGGIKSQPYYGSRTLNLYECGSVGSTKTCGADKAHYDDKHAENESIVLDHEHIAGWDDSAGTACEGCGGAIVKSSSFLGYETEYTVNVQDFACKTKTKYRMNEGEYVLDKNGAKIPDGMTYMTVIEKVDAGAQDIYNSCLKAKVESVVEYNGGNYSVDFDWGTSDEEINGVSKSDLLYILCQLSEFYGDTKSLSYISTPINQIEDTISEFGKIQFGKLQLSNTPNSHNLTVYDFLVRAWKLEEAEAADGEVINRGTGAGKRTYLTTTSQKNAFVNIWETYHGANAPCNYTTINGQMYLTVDDAFFVGQCDTANPPAIYQQDTTTQPTNIKDLANAINALQQTEIGEKAMTYLVMEEYADLINYVSTATVVEDAGGVTSTGLGIKNPGIVLFVCDIMIQYDISATNQPEWAVNFLEDIKSQNDSGTLTMPDVYQSYLANCGDDMARRESMMHYIDEMDKANAWSLSVTSAFLNIDTSDANSKSHKVAYALPNHDEKDGDWEDYYFDKDGNRRDRTKDSEPGYDSNKDRQDLKDANTRK